MSTTLLSAFYDIDFLCKVRGGEGREEDGQGGSPWSFQAWPSVLGFGGPLPSLTFWAWEKCRSLQCVLEPCGRGEGAGRKGRRESL